MSKSTTIPISDFCRTGSGTTPPRDKFDLYYGGMIPWVKSGELREDIITATEECVTERALLETSLKFVPAGAILVAMYGATVGRVGLLGIDATTNQAVCHIIPDPKLAWPRYLFYALRFKAHYFMERRVGGAQPNISQTTIKETNIFLPSLSEQRRIAAILDQADELRRKRLDSIARLDALSPAIFSEIFGDWRFSAPRWPLVPLGSKIDFLTSGSRGWAEYYRKEGGKFLRIQNVKRDELDLSDIAFVDAPATAEAQRTRVQSGDVLLSITADLGRTAVVPMEIGEAYINQHLAIVRSSVLVPRFLSAALASPPGQADILIRNREGVKAGLNFDDVRSIRIPDAPLHEQRKLAVRLSEVDKLKASHRDHIAKLDALFASLQHRAFRGELTSGTSSPPATKLRKAG